MRELLIARLRELARRAGMARVPTPVLVAGFVVLSVAVVAALVRWWPQPTAEGAVVTRAAARDARGAPTADASVAASRTVARADAAGSASASPSGSVCVHVVGAVRHPGVYSMAEGSRVEAVVSAAGGMTTAAAPSAINLAARLVDGEQIVVPTEEDVRSGGGALVGAGASGAGRAVGAPSGGTAAGAKVNLNTADATQLDALPGVGPSTAVKIVSDRQANGP